ncbi:NAD(P)-dependent oxidoreductase [Leifsonia poae]|uniref:NAD(P)-dependent oxidoreductase n=1 Tax=Leifsonia poae TaxID=110933 RepID=UPI001CC01AE1|nr:SDR family oxidoreductase [Leifsonia poae]
MKIVVFGANGPTGRLITRRALEAGHSVTAVTRRPEEFPLRNDTLRVVGADVHDPASVDEAVLGQDAVLSSLGVPYGKQPVTVYSEGVRNIMASMTEHDVRRLVCVSASLADPGAGPHGGFFVDKVAGPIVSYFGRTVYADMVRMEALVRASDLDWTIMRPNGLFETSSVTDYRMAEGYLNASFTSRADLADAMLRQLSSDEYLRKICAVATVAEKPRILQLLLREGGGKKAAA